MKLMRKKKASLDVINDGMLAFITFVLVAILVVTLIQVTKETSIVCPDVFIGDTCYGNCPANYTINTSAILCCNFSATVGTQDCATGNTTALILYDSGAYNATVDLQEAAALPPQFAQIIVIVVIIVGILGMLAFVGYGVYKKMKE